MGTERDAGENLRLVMAIPRRRSKLLGEEGGPSMGQVLAGPIIQTATSSAHAHAVYESTKHWLQRGGGLRLVKLRRSHASEADGDASLRNQDPGVLPEFHSEDSGDSSLPKTKRAARRVLREGHENRRIDQILPEVHGSPTGGNQMAGSSEMEQET